MVFMHIAQQLVGLAVIYHITGIFASIDTSGAQQAIMSVTHSLIGKASCPSGTATAGTLADVATLVTNIEDTVKVITGGCFIIGVAIGAIMYMISFGNDRRMALAKGALVAAIVGLAIFLASDGIQNYLITTFNTACTKV